MPLTARKVETAAPGRYTDGRGLTLLVKPSGARSWVLRYQMGGRRRDMGLGPWPEVTLAVAREKALAARREIVDGCDPLAARERPIVLTFEAAAEALIESKQPGWRNAKHAAQWGSTLAAYAYPKLGGLDVKAVATAAVLDVLRPIWTVKPETASRVRQRVEAVLDYATAMGARTGDNPARWRGHLENLLAKPGKVRAVKHHAALDWREAPAFMTALRSAEGTAAKALAFAILTAARSGEVRGMPWGELDLGAGVWTVPGVRIKAGKEHRVPLVPGALALAGEPGAADALVFASPSKGGPLSDMALTAVLRRMGRGDLTAHGFRSTFRDWAGEATAHPREVVEAALAHGLKDKAEAAYARGRPVREAAPAHGGLGGVPGRGHRRGAANPRSFRQPRRPREAAPRLETLIGFPYQQRPANARVRQQRRRWATNCPIPSRPTPPFSDSVSTAVRFRARRGYPWQSCS